MSTLETTIRDEARALLADGRVDLVLGYEEGTLPDTTRPCFITDAAGADRLVWNSRCGANLAVYLPRLFEVPPRVKEPPPPPRVGIVAKGCDLRSIVGLVKEKQVPRENIVIVGVPCQGLVDEAGVEAAACRACRHPAPEGADIRVEGEAREPGGAQYASVDAFEALSPEERWRYFEREMAKCIQCNACRQACPNCYCKVCFADQTKPNWVASSADVSDRILYHIGRLFHQAGRCVACDACVRACPMGIDLRTFSQKLVKDAEALFAYTPGLSLEDPPPLCTFRQEDSESFITEA